MSKSVEVPKGENKLGAATVPMPFCLLRREMKHEESFAKNALIVKPSKRAAAAKIRKIDVKSAD